MKLDRNTNPAGIGKYALIHVRELTPECKEGLIQSKRCEVSCGIVLPVKAISLGKEPDAQFFVLKYSDKFAAAALFAYSEAVHEEAGNLRQQGKVEEADGLSEYAKQIYEELLEISNNTTKIPD